MHHDDDVGAFFKGQTVTGLLIAAIAQVAFMNENFRCRQSFGYFHGIVRAGVVDQDHLVHDALRHDFIVGFDDGFFGVVGRHDHHDFFILKHALTAVTYG